MDLSLDRRLLQSFNTSQSRVAAYTHALKKRVGQALPEFVRPFLWLMVALVLAQTATTRLKAESIADWKQTNPTPRSLWRTLLIKGDPSRGWTEVSSGSARDAALFRALPLGIDTEHSVYGVPAAEGGWEYLAYFEVEAAPVFYQTATAQTPKTRMQWEPIGTSWDALLIVEETLRKLRSPRKAEPARVLKPTLKRTEKQKLRPDAKELIF